MLKTDAQAEVQAIQVRLERLETLLKVLAHDFQAPLRGILSLADWIGQDLPSEKSEAQENLKLLKARARRLESLFLAAVDYSKVGQSQEAPAELDLRALALGLFRELSQGRKADLNLDLSEERIRTQPMALRRVLEELLRNALKHHDKPEAKLGLRERDLGDFYEILVSDDGPGIDPRFHKEIFMPGRTLKSKDEIEGNGMGLALVARIVEELGGEFSVKSALKEGTAISIHWPKAY